MTTTTFTYLDAILKVEDSTVATDSTTLTKTGVVVEKTILGSDYTNTITGSSSKIANSGNNGYTEVESRGLDSKYYGGQALQQATLFSDSGGTARLELKGIPNDTQYPTFTTNLTPQSLSNNRLSGFDINITNLQLDGNSSTEGQVITANATGKPIWATPAITLGSTNTWTGANSFGNIVSTATLAPGDSSTKVSTTGFVTSAITAYNTSLLAAANTWSGVNTFSNIANSIKASTPIATSNDNSVSTTAYVTSAITAFRTSLLAATNTWTGANSFGNIVSTATLTAGDSSTKVSTTGFVTSALSAYNTSLTAATNTWTGANSFGNIVSTATLAPGDSSTKVSTTGFVTSALSAFRTSLLLATNNWTGANSFTAITADTITAGTSIGTNALTCQVCEVSDNTNIGTAINPSYISIQNNINNYGITLYQNSVNLSNNSKNILLENNGVNEPKLKLEKSATEQVILSPTGLSVGTDQSYGTNGQVLTRISGVDNTYGWQTPAITLGSTNTWTGANSFTDIVSTATLAAGDSSTKVSTTGFVTSAITAFRTSLLAATNPWTGANSFTDIVSTATLAAGDSSTKVSTTSFVTSAITAFRTSLLGATNSWTGSNSFGNIVSTATLTAGDSSTKVSTTSFVTSAITAYNTSLLLAANTWNGVNTFTTPPQSVTPVLGTDVSTKGYVDSMAGQYGGGLNLFLNYSVPGTVLPGTYKNLSKTVSTSPSQTVVNDLSITTAGSMTVLVASFMAEPLGLTVIPTGLWDMIIYGSVNNIAGTVNYFYKLYKYTQGGVSTLLGESSNTQNVNTDVNSSNPNSYPANLTISSEVTLLTTDRVYIELHAKRTGSTLPANSVLLTTYFEGSNYSYVGTSLNAGTTLLGSNNTWTGTNSFSTETIFNNTITFNRPLTLAYTTTPTAGTMLGGITTGTYATTGYPVTSPSTPKAIATLTIPTIGIYMVYFNFTINISGAVSIFTSVGGTALPLPACTVGITFVNNTIYTTTGTFIAPITTVGTLVLNMTLVGTVTSLANTSYSAVRIA